MLAEFKVILICKCQPKCAASPCQKTTFSQKNLKYTINSYILILFFFIDFPYHLLLKFDSQCQWSVAQWLM